MKKIKIIISGGGTGGHIYPGIAIANALKKQGHTICFVGALAISELCLAQKPVIFVPSPNVTADHQTKNAHKKWIYGST